jgi:hypothetical protein
MSTTLTTECDECGRNDVVGSIGDLHYCSRHEARVSASVILSWPIVHQFGPYDVHQIEPDHYAKHWHRGLAPERRRVVLYRADTIGEPIATFLP